MTLRSTDFVVDDSTPNDLLFNFRDHTGELKGRGYEERDFRVHPVEMFDPPSDIGIIPESDWSELIKKKEAEKSCLSHIRDRANNGQPFDALDQNGQGFCWYYSTTSCVMLLRAINNQPYVRLSAHAGACIIKNFRNEGGWCGLSAERQKSHGTPSVEFWPEKSMSRSNDKPETWANAALHKVSEDWIDIARPVYDRNLTFQQLATCLLLNIPCAVDFNWWGHSVCAMDLVEVEKGSFGIRILNSWTNSYGDRGTSVIRGNKAYPNGAVALRVTGASAA